MTTISQLTEKILEFRNARDWKKYHTPKNLSLSLIIEIGELFELLQWKQDEEILEEINRIKLQVTDELADVAIYLFLLAHELGVNLEQAIPEKLTKQKDKYPVGLITDEEIKWGKTHKSAD